MNIPEKNTLTHKNPEHSDRDAREQLERLKDIVYDSLGIPKERIVGRYMGEDVYEGDITFDPVINKYRIRLGDGRVTVVDPELLSLCGGTGAADAKAVSGVASGSLSVDPLRARVEAGAWKVDGLGAHVFDPSKAAVKVSLGSAQAHASAPLGDPLRDKMNRAENTVACIDMPEWRPDCDPNMRPEIYYHDRFPSIPIRSIIDDAILMLRAKKNLNISLHSFMRAGDCWRLIYKVVKDKTLSEKETEIIECIFTKKAFDRMTSEIDKYARLKARLDTNTFLKLRIAFLLYEAQKLHGRDARLVSLDVFRIVNVTTHPYFDF